MTVKRRDSLDSRRRRFLRKATLVAGAGALMGAGLAASAAHAGSKVTQRLAHYQRTPNGRQSCQACNNFLPAPSCKIVEDPIVPTGWCLLFAAKAS